MSYKSIILYQNYQNVAYQQWHRNTQLMQSEGPLPKKDIKSDDILQEIWKGNVRK